MLIFFLLTMIGINPGSGLAQEPTHLSILFTNDMHANFLPLSDGPHLGGYARLKTVIDRERKLNPNTLLIDAGDFEEGSIFYALGAGEESLRMLDRMGYDYAVVGNHDYFNGPAHFLDLVRTVKPRLRFLAANFNTKKFDQAEEFKKTVLPYEIREINGVKVAFIGITTYELVFDDFFAPVYPSNPFSVINRLAKQLRKKADVLIAVSHTMIPISKLILILAPEIDGVIAAHDHQKLTKPMWFKPPLINTNPKWIVEAGDQGRYLGRLDLKLFNRKDAARLKQRRVTLEKYKLIQIDSSIPEDSEIVRVINEDQNKLKGLFGDDFFNPIGFAITPLKVEGVDSVMGNLITDAYRERTGADIAVEHSAVISDGINEGPVTLADCFNSLGIAFNPVTKRSWNLVILPISGFSLQRLLLTLFNTPIGRMLGGMSMSGIEMIYKPIINTPTKPEQPSPNSLMEGALNKTEILINGEKINSLKMYRMAVGAGTIFALRTLNKRFPKLLWFPLDNIEDTGLESWRVLADHIKRHSPLSGHSVGAGRIRSLKPDLRVSQDNVTAIPKTHSDLGTEFQINVRIKNLGGRDSSTGRWIQLLTNKHGMDGTVDIENTPIADPLRLPIIPSGKSHDVSWNIMVPRSDKYYPITIRTDANKEELLRSNNETTIWVLPN